MPPCQNRGSFGTTTYVRVFVSDESDPRACPDCSDKVRGSNTVRDARS